MSGLQLKTGYSSNGLPYLRIGNGKHILVVIDGLDFTHKPPSPLQARLMPAYLKPLTAAGYTVYQVRRQPNLPSGYTMKDMADDYAEMIKNDFSGPVDVMGLSTGGPIAQELALGYPDLIRRLVLASTGCRLNPVGKKFQLDTAEFVRQKKFRPAAALFADVLAHGFAAYLLRGFLWLMGGAMFSAAGTLNDGIVEIEAEDIFDSRSRVNGIKMPVLVIGGDNDFFYDIKELGDAITGCRLILYNKAGHTAMMKPEFSRDLLSFLTESQ